MQKWEYKAVNVDKASPVEVETKLNLIGQDGWELVSGPFETAWGYLFTLKRPVSD
jgi:hypothetical protein